MFVVPGLQQSRCARVLLDSGAALEYGPPQVPAWIVDSIGYHFFQPITRVTFVFDNGGFSSEAGTVRIVESPENLLPVLQQLHSLRQVTVSAVHHDAIVDQLRRELPGVKVVCTTLTPDAVIRYWHSEGIGHLDKHFQTGRILGVRTDE